MYYVFAIGGTGARCLESLVFLCAMGLGPEKLHPIIIDPDLGNGNLNRTRDLIIRYKNVRSQINNPRKGSFFFTDIIYQDTDGVEENRNPIPNIYSPNSGLDIRMNTLRHFIEYNTLLTRDEKVYLADLLFSPAELDMDMEQGYRGIPSIGSVMMTEIERQAFWRVITGDLRANHNHRVFIFASAFGGTGASGYPVISQLIRNDAQNAHVGGALLLPYFTLKDPSVERETRPELRDQQILPNSNSFMMNTKTACEFYQDKFHSNNANYILGDDIEHSIRIEHYEPGRRAQLNDSHAIELMAALACLDFWNRGETNRGYDRFYHIQVHNPSNNNNDCFDVNINDIPCNDSKKHFERFALLCLYVIDLFSLIDKKNTKLLDKIAFFRDLDWRGEDLLNSRTEIEGLYDICLKFKTWVAQTHTNQAKLNIFNSELLLHHLLITEPHKYERCDISFIDTMLYHKRIRKNTIIDSLIATLSNTKFEKGGR